MFGKHLTIVSGEAKRTHGQREVAKANDFGCRAAAALKQSPHGARKVGDGTFSREPFLIVVSLIGQPIRRDVDEIRSRVEVGVFFLLFARAACQLIREQSIENFRSLH